MPDGCPAQSEHINSVAVIPMLGVMFLILLAISLDLKT